MARQRAAILVRDSADEEALRPAWLRAVTERCADCEMCKLTEALTPRIKFAVTMPVAHIPERSTKLGWSQL